MSAVIHLEYVYNNNIQNVPFFCNWCLSLSVICEYMHRAPKLHSPKNIVPYVTTNIIPKCSLNIGSEAMHV